MKNIFFCGIQKSAEILLLQNLGLTELLKDGQLVLEKFTDHTLANKMGVVSLGEIDTILSNPDNWYPGNEIYAINITGKDDKYLTDFYTRENIDKINNSYMTK